MVGPVRFELNRPDLDVLHIQVETNSKKSHDTQRSAQAAHRGAGSSPHRAGEARPVEVGPEAGPLELRRLQTAPPSSAAAPIKESEAIRLPKPKPMQCTLPADLRERVDALRARFGFVEKKVVVALVEAFCEHVEAVGAVEFPVRIVPAAAPFRDGNNVIYHDFAAEAGRPAGCRAPARRPPPPASNLVLV